jgi:hypothetical protein
VNKIAIFERDNWICQLCHTPTVKELRGTLDPRAPEVDHKDADRKNNDPSNLQCTHRACNRRKSKHQGEALARIVFTAPVVLNPHKFEVATDKLRSGQQKGGLSGGRKAVESGQLARACRATNETTNGRKGNGGRVKSKAKTAACHRSLPVARHVRWHVRRGSVNPKCLLCARRQP